MSTDEYEVIEETRDVAASLFGNLLSYQLPELWRLLDHLSAVAAQEASNRFQASRDAQGADRYRDADDRREQARELTDIAASFGALAAKAAAPYMPPF